MSRMKLVFDLMESGDYQAFELQALLATQRGEKMFQFANATYDVEFAANIIAYIYHKIAQQNDEHRFLYQQEPKPEDK